MLSSEVSERLAYKIVQSSFEAVTLEDLSIEVLPLLERFFDASASSLYHCNADGGMVALGGTLAEASPEYVKRYYSQDPLQSVCASENPHIFHAIQYPQFREYLNLPVYTEFAARYDYHDYIHVRLNTVEHPHEPGMVGLLLGRSKKQRHFSEEDFFGFARVLPALEALVRRNDRLERGLQVKPFVEALCNERPIPTMVFDLRGAMLWASRSAVPFFENKGKKNREVLRILTQAVRRLGSLLSKEKPGSPRLDSVSLPQEGSDPVRAELRLTRTRANSPFVIVELNHYGPSPILEEAAKKFELTNSETRVLWLVSQGFADRQIAQQLFVALPTVRSHIGHILSKMGVQSRLQAALMAHGIPLTGLFESD